MAITISSAASTKQLTTLATLKADLGITTTDDDTLLGLKIDQASAAIVSYCGREFAQETVVETLPAYGGMNILLTRTPVTTITSITYDSATVPAADYTLIEPTIGTVYNKSGWNDTRASLTGISGIKSSRSGEYLYTATYTGGYILPGMAGTRDLPHDIENACLQLAGMMYFNRKRDLGLKQESVSNVYSRTYSDSDISMGRFPESIATLLDKWKRYEV